MPQKGLKKGYEAWGSGKRLSSKVFSASPNTNPYWDQSVIKKGEVLPFPRVVLRIEPLISSWKEYERIRREQREQLPS